ncbi:hypothetical protein V6N13_023912 [Hibiscus sabdariffa]
MQNEAFLMKIAFNVIVNKEALWVRFLHSKYKCGTSLLENIRVASRSRLWKGLSMIWSDVRSYVRIRIGDGISTDFWRDSWIEGIDPLIGYVPERMVHNLGFVSVASMADDNGN